MNGGKYNKKLVECWVGSFDQDLDHPGHVYLMMPCVARCDSMLRLTNNSIIYSKHFYILHTILPDSSLNSQMSVYHVAVSLPSSRSHT